MPNKPISPAEEDYLKAIYELQRDEERVHTTELADRMGFSKPSVTAMVKRLAEMGRVDYSPRQGVRLTPAGRRATMQVLRRHRLLETFLVKVLDLDWSEVHAEAEVLEHHLSPRMVEAIDRVLGQPAYDPHGHPIPDARGFMRLRALVPLGELEPGDSGTVREVRTNNGATLQHWKKMGLVPGAELVIEQKKEFEDVTHITVGRRTIVTGSEGIEGVFVEMES